MENQKVEEKWHGFFNTKCKFRFKKVTGLVDIYKLSGSYFSLVSHRNSSPVRYWKPGRLYHRSGLAETASGVTESTRDAGYEAQRATIRLRWQYKSREQEWPSPSPLPATCLVAKLCKHGVIGLPSELLQKCSVFPLLSPIWLFVEWTTSL